MASFSHRSPFCERHLLFDVGHNPASAPSKAALAMLQSALARPFPPSSPKSQPLDFHLEVVEAPPTAGQLSTIMGYVGADNPSSIFLSAHPTAPDVGERPHTVKGVAKAASENPMSLKWPIVVNWDTGKASVGDVEGVKVILESLRKARDGDL
ncbi:hypothetical protein FISHEDRAFT_64365 [Fistulina hepatica ATCC 64428]|uniref:Uncharacterized protein n=1 Tax=Fistulina hepatica ATCC 64428 TaxID=1128425 RepID=A0A0D7AIG9_9AGAR|nr:hypothetical protein FISHEDRAFT_64365 [Fistulina hepatica ATCC 64428]